MKDSRPCKTSMMQFFAKTVHGQKSLTLFAKNFTIENRQVSKLNSDCYLKSRDKKDLDFG